MYEGFDPLLRDRPKLVADLAARLRTVARTAMPDLTERFYPHWEGLGLRHPVFGLLCTLFARDEDVTVYFERGAAMPDPQRVLGGGERLRQTRTLTFPPDSGATAEELFVEYLDLALEYALNRRRA